MDKSNWIGLGVAAACLIFIFLNENGVEQKDPEVEELQQTTMAIHDEAMKEMAAMNRFGRILKQELSTLDSLAPRADSIRTTIRQMKQAEDDMYTWMQEYKAPGKLPAAEAKVYMKDQLEKISRNNRDIRAASEAGRIMVEHQ